MSLFPPDLQKSIEVDKKWVSDKGEDAWGQGWMEELPPKIVNVIKKHQKHGRLSFKGEGSARAVFDLEGGYVLKVAKFESGIPQTQNEISVWKKFKGTRWLPKVWKFDPGGRWIIMEEVVPDPAAAEELLHFGRKGSHLKPWYVANLMDLVDSDPEELREVEAYLTPDQKSFLEFVRQAGLDTADIYEDHMGRTADGRLVLMDFGV